MSGTRDQKSWGRTPAPPRADYFTAGVFYGLMRADPSGTAVRDVTETEVREAMAGWLAEQAAEAGEPI